MIKRSSINSIKKILEENTNLNVLDIGCGYTANKFADVLCDVQDLSDFYPKKKFVKLNSDNLPFKDKEFDFVIASHVLEHVKDPELFVSELERISKKGYIEIPTSLEDNLVFENKNDHLWHIKFDDDKKKLLISKKIQIIEPILTVSSSQKLREYFRDSLVIELFWENSIEYSINKNDNINYKKISLFNLFRKFLSKKIRNLF